MLSDPGAVWSEKLGLKNGERTKRYALILDDLIVKSVEVRRALVSADMTDGLISMLHAARSRRGPACWNSLALNTS